MVVVEGEFIGYGVVSVVWHFWSLWSNVVHYRASLYDTG